MLITLAVHALPKDALHTMSVCGFDHASLSGGGLDRMNGGAATIAVSADQSVEPTFDNMIMRLHAHLQLADAPTMTC